MNNGMLDNVMNVKELIELLKYKNPYDIVFFHGTEDGVVEATSVEEHTVRINNDISVCYGQHQIVDDDDVGETVSGVVID